MRKGIFTAILLFSAATAAQAFTLMSFNIKDCNGMDGTNDPQRTAVAINAVRPDVVAIQEVDSMTNRCGHRDMLAILGRETGLHHYFAPAIDYDGGRYGIGLLTRSEPLAVTRRALPGREEARAIIVAEFPDCFVASTHLSLTPEDSRAAADIIAEMAAAAGKPFIIMGDFNSTPGSATITALEGAGFSTLSNPEVFTFPSDVPDRTLDYVMFYPAASAPVPERVEVIADPLTSDHRPLVVAISGFGNPD